MFQQQKLGENLVLTKLTRKSYWLWLIWPARKDSSLCACIHCICIYNIHSDVNGFLRICTCCIIHTYIQSWMHAHYCFCWNKHWCPWQVREITGQGLPKSRRWPRLQISGGFSEPRMSHRRTRWGGSNMAAKSWNRGFNRTLIREACPCLITSVYRLRQF